MQVSAHHRPSVYLSSGSVHCLLAASRVGEIVEYIIVRWDCHFQDVVKVVKGSTSKFIRLPPHLHARALPIDGWVQRFIHHERFLPCKFWHQQARNLIKKGN